MTPEHPRPRSGVRLSPRWCVGVLRRALIATLLLAAGAPANAIAYDDSGYLAYMDRMHERLGPTWDDYRGFYAPGLGSDALVNAEMLLSYSVAAQAGHEGPARDDRRARQIAAALVSAPAFADLPTTPAAPGSQYHAPGWTSSLYLGGLQHVGFDAGIVDALAHAWKARRELGLSDETTALIVDRIHRVAQSPFFRWPSIRLNQINWYAVVYAADATVTGEPTLLRRDFRAQLGRFLGGPNFGAGLRFRYHPHVPRSAPMNVDSAEYANIVLSWLRFYPQARNAGMPPLTRRNRSLVRAWQRRALAGYWTHGGYLNWDTGLGFERWHQAKKLGLAQQALIGMAQTPELQPGRAWGRWAKWTFDRGLRFYERLPAAEGGLPAPVLFELYSVPQGVGSARLAAARMQGNAARALESGLGRMRGAQPPPLYAFDPDIGRLAVTTPAYNTAIVAVNQRAFPYGGIELARLFDGEQRVAANVGGRAPAAFGLLVRDRRGRRSFSSQTPRAQVDPAVTPLRLRRAPLGTRASASTPLGRAFAAPFRDLRARGSSTAGPFRAIASYRFTPTAIDTSWMLKRRHGRARLRADVLFPSWGRDARVVAVRRDGSRVSLRAGTVPLSQVARFEVTSARTGYLVIPLHRPADAVAHLLRTSRQSSNPDPGPTLAVQVARGSRWQRARFSARIVIGTPGAG